MSGPCSSRGEEEGIPRGKAHASVAGVGTSYFQLVAKSPAVVVPRRFSESPAVVGGVHGEVFE
jgi:hypothetical protein